MMIDFKNGSFMKLKMDNPAQFMEQLSPLLVGGEEIIGVYKTVRDYVAFTSKRIIAVNIQGITGKKKDFTSIPYSKIQTFSVETAGHFDLDSELEVYVSSVGMVKFEFSGKSDIIKIGQLIGSHIL